MEIICLDTDILISYKRAKDKEATKFFQLSFTYQFSTTVITVYELLRGDDSAEDKFWKDFFSKILILDMDAICSENAAGIYRHLKQNGNIINMEDILIASIALRYDFKIATINTKHFNRIPGLTIV
jgi:predicted nucleic acid-binding protein